MTFLPQPKPPKHKKRNKTEEWKTIRDNEIIPQFKEWGIVTCEIGLFPCVKYRYLGFAHTKKRRQIRSQDDLRRVVLACEPCHSIAEYSCVKVTGKPMTEFLEEIIKKREKMLAKRLLHTYGKTSIVDKEIPAYDRPLG
jgi:hypothetical protein